MAAALLSSGCFGYVPAELGAVPPGEDVRVHLAQDATVADLATVSRSSDLSFDGRLVGGDRNQLILRVLVTLQPVGIVARTLGQDITIPAGRIVQLERRELNRARTGVALAGGVAALTAVIFSFGKGVRDPELPPRPQDVELRGVGWTAFLWSIPVR